MLKNPVQVVNFASFLDGVDKETTANAILKSFQETGFVYLVNHGFPQSKIDTMFKWSKKFFSLSLDEKMLAPHPPSGVHHRGYSRLGQEKVVQHIYGAKDIAENKAHLRDMKENFECGREEDEAMPNIWLPENVLPGFRKACLDFFWLAIAFNLHEDYFAQFHTKPDNQLRLLHYPSVSKKDLEMKRITRIDGHSDFGSITILFQDDVGGLEVEDPNSSGTFLSVPPVPGSVVVNAGDLMRWSNDTIRSTIHRVRAPLNVTPDDSMVPERYSIPYFASPDFSAVIDIIPGTWSDKRPKRYEPISAGAYIMKRLAADY